MEYQILHIEDSKFDADLVKRLIQKSGIDFSYELASDESEVMAALDSFKPNVILCDHSLPTFNSRMAYELCKERNPDLTFILVTGTVSEDFAVEMLRAGIDDYLLKTNLLRLPVAIENAYSKRAAHKNVEAIRKSLQESETHLRTIFQNSASGLILIDRNYKILELNDRAKFYNRISFDYELEKNQNLLERLPLYRREEVQKNIDKSLLGKKIQYESVFPLSDGQSIRFTVKLIPTINNIGQVTGVCITIDDITEQKRFENALRESESLNRSILSSIDYHMAVIDSNGEILSVNKAWNDFSIQNGEPALNRTGIGSNYLSVCKASADAGDGHALAALNGFKQVINKNTPYFEMEYPCHSKNEQVWFLLRIVHFLDDSEKVVMIHIDITDSKKAMILKEKITSGLAERNRDLEQFSYIISHKLRAPVANILGLANIWNLPSLGDDEKDELALAMYESANKIDTVVKDLNQILHVSNRDLKCNEEILFSRIVEEIKIDINTFDEAENIKIKCDFSKIDAFLTVKSYMYSIFYNLITNSIRFRQPETTCLITIKSNLVDNKLLLNFTDNGLGIDLQSRANEIFGLYNRFHSHIEGKGIGLFMVKAHVEKLGGEISIKSEVNKGTEFKIEFEL